MSPCTLLLRYKQWANARLLEDLAVVPEAELLAPRPFLFGSVLATLTHTFLIDQVWQAHLKGVPHGQTSRQPSSVPGLQGLSVKVRALDDWYVGYAEGLSASALNEDISFTFIDGGQGRMTRVEILIHVANHATYHRGHMSALIQAAGFRHRSTDLPVFLEEPNI